MFKHYQKGNLDFSYIIDLITRVNDQFVPPLSSELDVVKYAKKIQEYANCVIFEENEVVAAFIFYYIINSTANSIFISLIYSSKSGFGRLIYNELIKYCNPDRVILEVDPTNFNAISFYEKIGFEIDVSNTNINKLKLIHSIK